MYRRLSGSGSNLRRLASVREGDERGGAASPALPSVAAPDAAGGSGDGVSDAAPLR